MKNSQMEPVKKIEQLRQKEAVLEDINKIQLARLKNDASPVMLIAAGIAGALGIMLFISMFRRKTV